MKCWVQLFVKSLASAAICVKEREGLTTLMSGGRALEGSQALTNSVCVAAVSLLSGCCMREIPWCDTNALQS